MKRVGKFYPFHSHHQVFLDNILNISALKKPEDLLEIDAMEKGSLVYVQTLGREEE